MHLHLRFLVITITLTTTLTNLTHIRTHVGSNQEVGMARVKRGHADLWRNELCYHGPSCGLHARASSGYAHHRTRCFRHGRLAGRITRSGRAAWTGGMARS